MIKIDGSRRRNAFSSWLRTGKLPPAVSPDGLEFKFNPWHDPADGRFTFAGSGRLYGAGGAEQTNHMSRRPNGSVGRAPGTGDRERPQIAATPSAQAPRARPIARAGQSSAGRGSVRVQPTPVQGSRTGNQPNPAAEFVVGVGQGLYNVGEGTVTGVHAALTTNPATTVNNASRMIAGMIDTAIAAEDTPARIQISRAADAVANASARDIGRATGSVAGNVALAIAPGAALSKVSALRRLRMARPGAGSFPPPEIGCGKENLGRDSPAKQYNDTATGARPGQAPTLMRTLPDGSKRPVKFDGVQGETVIDRKWKVVNAPHARAQLLRQSAALAQHRLIGVWEVPTPRQKTKALRLLQRMGVTNIKVRVVKP